MKEKLEDGCLLDCSASIIISALMMEAANNS
jgi:hypothetical protein